MADKKLTAIMKKQRHERTDAEWRLLARTNVARMLKEDRGCLVAILAMLDKCPGSLTYVEDDLAFDLADTGYFDEESWQLTPKARKLLQQER